MNAVIKQIPNTITCLNLFSGILAVISAYNGNFSMAMIYVFASAVFDFMDGFAARLLKAYSDMGKELDSLSDMVSFGLVPGVVAFRLLEPSTVICEYIPYIGFLVTVFSALRLAKFNIDERQTTSFIGLAVPANALFWIGLAYSFNLLLTEYQLVVYLLIALSCFLLVSPIPMFSLKIKTLRWSANRIRYIFLIGTIILLVLYQLKALSLIIVWYIILSLIDDFFSIRH